MSVRRTSRDRARSAGARRWYAAEDVGEPREERALGGGVAAGGRIVQGGRGGRAVGERVAEGVERREPRGRRERAGVGDRVRRARDEIRHAEGAPERAGEDAEREREGPADARQDVAQQLGHRHFAGRSGRRHRQRVTELASPDRWGGSAGPGRPSPA